MQEVHHLSAAEARKGQRPAPRRAGTSVPVTGPEGRGREGGARHDGSPCRLLRAVRLEAVLHDRSQAVRIFPGELGTRRVLLADGRVHQPHGQRSSFHGTSTTSVYVRKNSPRKHRRLVCNYLIMVSWVLLKGARGRTGRESDERLERVEICFVFSRAWSICD